MRSYLGISNISYIVPWVHGAFTSLWEADKNLFSSWLAVYTVSLKCVFSKIVLCNEFWGDEEVNVRQL